MPKQKFYKSVANAFDGILHFITFERNGRIQFAIMLLIIILAFVFKIDKQEYIMLFLCIAAVLCMEMINTAIEKICDIIQPEHDERIKVIKHISAGAVLIATITSVITGVLIFVPRILN